MALRFKSAVPVVTTLCLFMSSRFASVQSQSMYYMSNAGISSLSSDRKSWAHVTGDSDENAGIYASYSKLYPVEADLLVVTNSDNKTLITGCSLDSVPRNNASIVLLARGECPFRTKSRNVYLSGGAAMILQNFNKSPNPLWMSPGNSKSLEARSIVSVAVPYNVGLDLLTRASTRKLTVRIVNKGEYTGYPSDSDRFRSQIIFYSAGVAIAAMVLVMATRICRRRVPYNTGLLAIHIGQEPGPSAEKKEELMRRLERYQYSTESGSINDTQAVTCEDPTCCICISEFEKMESIIRLPCSHEFHEECITEWLREHLDCPLCKADVYAMVFSEEQPPVQPSQDVEMAALTSIAYDQVVVESELHPFLAVEEDQTRDVVNASISSQDSNDSNDSVGSQTFLLASSDSTV